LESFLLWIPIGYRLKVFLILLYNTYNKKRKYKENNKKNSTFVHSFNLYV
jgi:hypothetical protein